MTNRSDVLLLFDVDGTLTLPRRCIADTTRVFLMETVLPRVQVGLVSGSDYPKIVEQMNGEEAVKKFDHVFCENGLVHYQNGRVVREESMLSFVGEEKIQTFINFCFGYMSKLKLPAKRGNFIEFRKGMVNVSPVGRSCSQAERDAFAEYDARHGIRRDFIEAMRDAFPDSGLQFALGGQISVDVFPIGWDKTYCLNSLDSSAPVHFFGDRTEPGGNDHELYEHPRTVGHRVTSPEDTVARVAALLESLQ